MSSGKRKALLLIPFVLLAFAGVASAKDKPKPSGPSKRPHAPPGWKPDPKLPSVDDPKGPQVQPLNPDGPIDGPDPIRVPDEPTPSRVDDVIKTYPTPATFYQVVKGDAFLGNQGISTRLARTALFLAAKKQGMSDAEANAWAAPRANDPQSRIEVTRDIACVPYNDVRFGTYAFPKDKVIPGLQGRGIRLLPINADDASRIRQGMPAVRNVRLSSPGAPSSTSAAGVEPFDGYELLWLPGYDLDLLFASNGKTWEVGGTWSDGSSKIHPPPLIYGLGIRDYTDAGLGVWGCIPNTAEIG